MLVSEGAEEVYANDPPKLRKCVKYGVGSLLFWMLVMYYGYSVKDYQCAVFVYQYAVFWNALTLLVNITDVIMKKLDFDFWSPSEDILHFLTLLGGGPATVLTMIILKQKVQKPSYQETFFTWCGLSILWMLFVLFIVFSYQQILLEFFR